MSCLTIFGVLNILHPYGATNIAVADLSAVSGGQQHVNSITFWVFLIILHRYNITSIAMAGLFAGNVNRQIA